MSSWPRRLACHLLSWQSGCFIAPMLPEWQTLPMILLYFPVITAMDRLSMSWHCIISHRSMLYSRRLAFPPLGLSSSAGTETALLSFILCASEQVHTVMSSCGERYRGRHINGSVAGASSSCCSWAPCRGRPGEDQSDTLAVSQSESLTCESTMVRANSQARHAVSNSTEFQKIYHRHQCDWKD